MASLVLLVVTELVLVVNENERMSSIAQLIDRTRAHLILVYYIMIDCRSTVDCSSIGQ